MDIHFVNTGSYQNMNTSQLCHTDTQIINEKYSNIKTENEADFRKITLIDVENLINSENNNLGAMGATGALGTTSALGTTGATGAIGTMVTTSAMIPIELEIYGAQDDSSITKIITSGGLQQYQCKICGLQRLGLVHKLP